MLRSIIYITFSHLGHANSAATMPTALAQEQQLGGAHMPGEQHMPDLPGHLLLPSLRTLVVSTHVDHDGQTEGLHTVALVPPNRLAYRFLCEVRPNPHISEWI